MSCHRIVQEVVALTIAFAVGSIVMHVKAKSAAAAFDGIQRIDLDEPFGSWVSALPDGRLMSWWSEDKPGASDETGSVQLAIARFSSDDGANWSKPRVLFEFPRVEGKGRYEGQAIGGILCDTQGGIHIFGRCWTSWSWEEFKGQAFVFHVMSDDNCETWSDVQSIPTGYNYSGIHQPLVLKNGRIVLPMWHAFDDKNDWGSICALSDDRGTSWQVTGEMGPTLKDEQSGVQLSDGRILMLFRKYVGGNLIQTISSDGGQTWQNIRDSRFIAPASPPTLKRLKDGRILLIWNNSQKPKHVFDRLILAAAISNDDGKTWRGYREIARTNGVPGPGGWVCYPYITQARNGKVFVTYGSTNFKSNLLQLDPDWLEETGFKEDFSTGLDNWITLRTQGPQLVDHPDNPDRKVLQLSKPNPDMASGASLNFPFGAKGKINLTIRLQPGFQGARICLTDHFTWPSYAEDGRFGIQIWENGKVVEPLPAGESAATGTELSPDQWHTLQFSWDCAKNVCALAIDSKDVTELQQFSAAPGLCYLRLWSSAKTTDNMGLLVGSVEIVAEP